MIEGELTLRKVQNEVRRIMKLSCEPETHWEAENAERDLNTMFVKWCAESLAANDPREVTQARIPMAEKKPKRGRPRKFIDGKFVGFNVRLSKEAWKELHAMAQKKDVPMSDLARDAISEWLLACKVGQRPISARGAT